MTSIEPTVQESGDGCERRRGQTPPDSQLSLDSPLVKHSAQREILGKHVLYQDGYLQSSAILIARADGSQASKIVDGVALQASEGRPAWRPASE